MIRFDCPQCGKRCKAPVEAAGRRAKCSRCGASVLIPSSVAVLVAPSPADPPRQDQFTTELVCQDCGQRFSVPQDQVGTGRPILCSHCGRPFTGRPRYVPPPEPPPVRQQPPAPGLRLIPQTAAQSLTSFHAARLIQPTAFPLWRVAKLFASAALAGGTGNACLTEPRCLLWSTGSW